MTAERRAVPIRKSVARKLGDALDRASPSFRRPSSHWNSSKLGGGKARFTRYRRDISSIPPDFRIVIGRVNGFAVHGVDDVIRLTRSKVFRDVKRGPYTRDDSISKKTKRKSKAAKFSNEIKRGPRSRERSFIRSNGDPVTRRINVILARVRTTARVTKNIAPPPPFPFQRTRSRLRGAIKMGKDTD